jgi:hypothetical protein
MGGNVVLFAQAAENRADADRLQQRVKDADSDRVAVQSQLDQLKAQMGSNASVAANPAVPTVAPGQAPPVGTPAPRPTTPPAAVAAAGPDTALLQRIETQVQRIRGLPATSDVPLKVLDPVALREYFAQSFERDYLPSERESDQKLLVTLGLMDPSVNLVQVYLDLLQEQVIGVYDDDEKAMYVIGDANFSPAEQTTFAHEYTHALQDQSYTLQSLVPKHGGSDDRSAAIHALIEGDAVLSQTLWMQQFLTRDELRQATQGGDSPILDQAPRVLREELLFPYLDGVNFVVEAYRNGGYGAVNRMFSDPPASTEQVLHPEKYRAGEQPVDVVLPDLAAGMGDGWSTLDSNTMGELDTRILLEQYGDDVSAKTAAAGWGGDRWALLEKDGRQAVVLKTAWDTDTDAGEFFVAMSKGLQKRFSGATVEESSDSRQALTTASMATELQRNGQGVTMVISFDRASATGLATASGS